MADHEFVVGMSGASGTRLGLRFVELLAMRPEVAAVHLVVSEGALLVARTEHDGRIRTASDLVERLDPTARAKVRLHDDGSLAAPISSGSYPVSGMAVVPCSAATLGAVAVGASRGLLHRACDVTLKQRRPLILALRESPLSLIHAENIRSVTLAGAVVAPPVPPYYLGDDRLDVWLDHSAHRVMDLLGLPPVRDDLRWGRPGGPRESDGA